MHGDMRAAPDSMKQNEEHAKAPPLIFDPIKTGAGGSQGTRAPPLTYDQGTKAPPLTYTPEMSFDTTSAPQSETKVEEQKPDGTFKTTTTNTQPVFKTNSSVNQQLFNPLQANAQQGQQALTQAAQTFQQQAGPSRSFEGIGGGQTINQAVQQGQGMDEARALAAARYGGPSGLDTGALAELDRLYEDMDTRQEALGTGGGLATLLRQAAPLTRGEAEFEAKRRLPEAKVQARDFEHQIVNPFRSQVDTAAREAEQFAQQRMAEENAIREAAREQLTGRETEIDTELQRRIKDAQAYNQSAEDAYTQILGEETGSGRLKAIQGASDYLQSGTAGDPGELQGQEVADAFNTEGLHKTIAGRQALDAVLADEKYAEVSEYGPLEHTITKRGKGFYGVRDKDGNVVDLRQIESDPSKRQLLYQRQREMEKLAGGANSGGGSGGGEFFGTNTLYNSEGDFKQADARTYMGFDPGMKPSRGNMSSAEQRGQYNRINDLLGELDRIGEEQPFRAAKIFAEAKRFIEEEDEALKARGEKMTKKDREWAGMVKKARKNYKKKEAVGKPWTQISDIVKSGMKGDPFVGAKVAMDTGKYLTKKSMDAAKKSTELNPQLI